VAQNPVKMIMLFGGSVLITLAYVGALAASIQAFGGGPGIILIGAVYMGAAAIAAAAPSPGGLGAIEAALVAGLTGVGMAAGPAVSAVLLYRLATYWLPVAPGWLSWRALLRQGLRMKPRAALLAACIGLAATLSACTSSTGHASSAAGKPAAGSARSSRSGRSISPRVSCSPRFMGRRSRRTSSRYGSCRT
jgi:hypothetical protein